MLISAKATSLCARRLDRCRPTVQLANCPLGAAVEQETSTLDDIFIKIFKFNYQQARFGTR